MGYAITFLVGYLLSYFYSYYVAKDHIRRIKVHEDNTNDNIKQAVDDLMNFNNKVQANLNKAREEFAKQNLTRLLYELLQEIVKEKK